jgi:hypothetical protein
MSEQAGRLQRWVDVRQIVATVVGGLIVLGIAALADVPGTTILIIAIVLAALVLVLAVARGVLLVRDLRRRLSSLEGSQAEQARKLAAHEENFGTLTNIVRQHIKPIADVATLKTQVAIVEDFAVPTWAQTAITHAQRNGWQVAPSVGGGIGFTSPEGEKHVLVLPIPADEESQDLVRDRLWQTVGYATPSWSLSRLFGKRIDASP